MVWTTWKNLENVFQRPQGKATRLSPLMAISIPCHSLWKLSYYNRRARFEPRTWRGVLQIKNVGFSRGDQNHYMLPVGSSAFIPWSSWWQVCNVFLSRVSLVSFEVHEDWLWSGFCCWSLKTSSARGWDSEVVDQSKGRLQQSGLADYLLESLSI